VPDADPDAAGAALAKMKAGVAVAAVSPASVGAFSIQPDRVICLLACGAELLGGV
jgi:hypothetical protein